MTLNREKKYLKMLTYGCQMNFSDAERMEGELAKLGYESIEDMEQADLIMINTCAVRENAEDKVYGKIGEIKNLKRKNPDLILGITGCMAQKEGEKLIKRAPHIDFVLGTNKIQEVVSTVSKLEQAQEKHIVIQKSMKRICLRIFPFTVKTAYRPGCPSCTAAIISAPIALCPMCAAGSAAAVPKMW